jgi:universal stress protein E
MSGTSFERVLVALKPWQSGLPLAAAHARALTQNFGGQLRVVSCVFDSQVAYGLEQRREGALAAQSGMLERERIDLERLAQSLRDWGAAVETRVLWDAPAYQGALRAAREWPADLLVVGAHERHPALRTRLTDTDWQLMRLCPCPLLLVKDPVFDGYSTILAAVDPVHPQSAASGVDDAVLDAAAAFGRAFGATIDAVHAFPDAASFNLASSVEVAPGEFVDAADIEIGHRRAVAELLARHGLADIQVDFVPGEAGAAIVARAVERRAKLVVLGALRRSRIEQVMLGSTAERVSADLECDVLLVPAAPQAPDAASTNTAQTAKRRRR